MRRSGALVTVMVLVTGCSGGGSESTSIDASEDLISAAQDEGEVTLYIVPQEETVVEWVQDFEQEHGVGVATHRQSQNQLWERWQQETRADQHLADIVIFNDPTLLESAQEEGWVAEFTPGSDAEFDDDVKEPGAWYPVYTSGEVLAWNTNEVSDEEAERLRSDGFQALEDDAWEGRLGTVTPHATDRVLATYYELGEERSEEFGWDYLDEVGAATSTFYESAQPAVERLVAGEHAVILGSADTLVSQPAVDGAPVEFVYPEPTTGVPFYIAISENAANPHAAELFAEWATTSEPLANLAEISNGLPAHEGVEDHRPITGLDWYEAPAELDLEWHTNQELWDEQSDFLDQWSEAFGYQP